MKIKLLASAIIDGKVTAADEVVEVEDDHGEHLIAHGGAEKTSSRS